MTILKRFSEILFIGFIGVLVGSSCVPLDQGSTTNTAPKTLIYDDKLYDQSVGAILLYSQTPLNPPIANLRSQEMITLEFDLFEDASDYIHIKLIHCDASWKKSRISDLLFLDDYNQFLVTDYRFSENTTVNYVHYMIDVPKPKISGNYLLIAYRGTNQKDLLFSRRMMYVENLVDIASEVVIPRQVDRRNTDQDISLSIGYENLVTNNPQQELNATIRQNYRWDKAKMNVRANNDLINEKRLDFQVFSDELAFPGGNEFRMIDLRSLSVPGFNVGRVQKEDNGYYVSTLIFQPFQGEVYTRPVNDDLNGDYFHAILEPGADKMEADYAVTTFNFDLGSQVSEPVYLVGRFNSWKHDPTTQLRYNENTGLYQVIFDLKQGIYEFTVEGNTENSEMFFGKSFRLTENEYDVIVYQRAIGLQYDRIVGYFRYSSGRN